ncbi:hypothetical protein [Nonomuraea jabiensis]|uniref:hypothetical protein n=1 Tax=Nonomuraea jabiensis TaxID=882448 RepID=UPI003D73E2E3
MAPDVFRDESRAGSFRQLPACEIQTYDVVIEGEAAGEVWANAEVPPFDENVICVLVEGTTRTLGPNDRVRLFRPDDPSTISTCECGASSLAPHDYHACGLLSELREAARAHWPDLAD